MTDRALGVPTPGDVSTLKPVDVRFREIIGSDLHLSILDELNTMNIEGIHSPSEAFISVLSREIADGSMAKEQSAELAVLWMTDNPEDSSGHVESFLIEISTRKG